MQGVVPPLAIHNMPSWGSKGMPGEINIMAMASPTGRSEREQQGGIGADMGYGSYDSSGHYAGQQQHQGLQQHGSMQPHHGQHYTQPYLAQHQHYPKGPRT